MSDFMVYAATLSREQKRCAYCERGDVREQNANGLYEHPYQDRWMERDSNPCFAPDAVAAHEAWRKKVLA